MMIQGFRKGSVAMVVVLTLLAACIWAVRWQDKRMERINSVQPNEELKMEARSTTQ
jgi:hypothetical protein